MQGTLIKEPQRWSDRLQAYDFEIVYDECKDNIVASALYQQDEPTTFNSISFNKPTWVQKFLVDHIMDLTTHEVHLKIGVILSKNRIYLQYLSPISQALQYIVICVFQSMGFYKTQKNVSSNCYQQKMKNDIEQFVVESKSSSNRVVFHVKGQ